MVSSTRLSCHRTSRALGRHPPQLAMAKKVPADTCFCIRHRLLGLRAESQRSKGTSQYPPLGHRQTTQKAAAHSRKKYFAIWSQTQNDTAQTFLEISGLLHLDRTDKQARSTARHCRLRDFLQTEASSVRASQPTGSVTIHMLAATAQSRTCPHSRTLAQVRPQDVPSWRIAQIAAMRIRGTHSKPLALGLDSHDTTTQSL